MKRVLSASLLFFILNIFAFPGFSIGRLIALSLILGLIGETLTAIEEYLKEINDKLNKMKK